MPKEFIFQVTNPDGETSFVTALTPRAAVSIWLARPSSGWGLSDRGKGKAIAKGCSQYPVFSLSQDQQGWITVTNRGPA